MLVIFPMLGRAVDYIKHTLLEEAERWGLWLPVFFGAGIGFYFSLKNEPTLYMTLSAVALGCGIIVVGRKRMVAKMASIAILAAILGFATAKVNTEISKSPRIYNVEKPVTISGNVVSISYSSGFPSLLLEDLRIDEIDQKYLPKKMRLNVRTRFKEPVRPGDRIITDAKLQPPARPSIPGAYDFSLFGYFTQTGANGFAVKQIVKLKEGHKESYINSLRFDISNKIRAAVPGDAGAMSDAIITGERSYMSKQAMEDMRKSGLFHLIAISGINLVLAGGVMFFIVRFLLSLSPRITEYYPTKKIAAIAAIFSCLFYLLIAGMPVTASRSFVMVVLIMLAILFDRMASPMRSIAFAAIIILLVVPESMLGPSFQMSFAATLALVSVYEFFSRRQREDEYDDNGKVHWYKRFWNKLWLYPLTVVSTSLIAGLATAPYAAFHFSQFVNYGLVANLLAIPVTTFVVMPFAVIGFLLMPLGLEEIGFIPMGWGNGLILQIAEEIASWPGSAMLVPQIPVWGLVMISLGGLWLLIWQRNWRFAGLLLIVIGLASPFTMKLPDIIINENGKLFAINQDGKLYLSALRNSNASKNWLRHFAQVEREPMDKHEIYEVKGYSFTMKCWPADIVVDMEEQGCKGNKLTITKKQLLEQGTHNIYLTPDGIVVETVEDRRGKRPWTNY